MGLFSFIHGKTGRLILHRLYGWGASLVILGALFKIMHWQFAGLMLTVGMTTECIIFFLSAFEPLPKDFDWSLVYPEFAGDDGEIQEVSTNRGINQKDVTSTYTGVSNLNLDISPEASNDLKAGIQKLTNSLNQMSSLTGIVDASNELTGTIHRATNSMNTIEQSANILTENYQKTAQTISNLNEQSKAGLEQIRTGYDVYKDQLNNLSNTLGAINLSYELYLQETKKVQNDYSQLHSDMEKLIDNVQLSTTQTQKFSNQMEGLNDNVAQLNSIYGSMLTAVNTVINKL